MSDIPNGKYKFEVCDHEGKTTILARCTVRGGKIVKYSGMQHEYLTALLTGDDTLLMEGSGDDKPIGLLEELKDE